MGFIVAELRPERHGGGGTSAPLEPDPRLALRSPSPYRDDMSGEGRPCALIVEIEREERHHRELDGSAPWNHFRELPGAEGARWFHGANHAAHGYFRPWPRCCMDEETEPFCPFCCEALARWPR